MFDPNLNRLLEILFNSPRLNKYNSQDKRKIVNRIVKDLDESNIFGCQEDAEENEFLFLEESVSFDREQKVLDKQAELSMIKELNIDIDGFVKPQKSSPDRQKTFCFKEIYGRSPLHKAIAERNLDEIKLLADKKLYLLEVDNNGDTAYEMTMFEDYPEARDIIKKNMDELKTETIIEGELK